MIYKDMLYKDQNVPSTEALLSEWRHRYYIKDTENLKKNKRFAVLKQFLIILIEHTACISPKTQWSANSELVNIADFWPKNKPEIQQVDDALKVPANAVLSVLPTYSSSAIAAAGTRESCCTAGTLRIAQRLEMSLTLVKFAEKFTWRERMKTKTSFEGN